MRNALPMSIVVGASIIGLGVFFGLRAGAPSPVGVAEPPVPQAVAGVSPPVADAPANVGSDGVRDATAAVDEARPRWRAACWDAADPATRTAGRYTAALAFDEGGTLVVSGIDETRGASDPAIAQCVRQNLGALRIPAPGQPLRVEVPFALP